MRRGLFKIFSYIFHPILMPLIGILIILSISHLTLLPIASKKAILSLVAIITVFFPLTIIPILYYQKLITGITISNRRERLLPMFLTSIFYYFGYFMLHKYSAPVFLQEYMLVVFISVLTASVINIKWKISLHMIGIGGLIGLLSALAFLFGIHNSIVFMISIIVAGIIGTSRLYLSEHTSTQIYSGFLLGYILNFGVIVMFNII